MNIGTSIMPWLLIALTMSLLLLSSCGRHVKAQKFVAAVGAERLTAYAVELEQKDSWKSVGGQLPIEMWDEGFVGHGVLKIQPYFNGLLIVLEAHDRVDRGVYISMDKSQVPEDGSGIYFEKLAEGVYWFEQKIRDKYIPQEQRNR